MSNQEKGVCQAYVVLHRHTPMMVLHFIQHIVLRKPNECIYGPPLKMIPMGFHERSANLVVQLSISQYTLSDLRRRNMR